MTEAPNPDEHHGVPDSEGPIKTPKQLVLAVILAFAVPILVIQLLVHLVAAETKPSAGSNAMQPAAVATRIQPVGQFEVATAASAAAAEAATEASAPASAATAAAADAQAAMAKVAAAPAAPAPAVAAAGAPPPLYAQVCFACHSTGVAGAPKLGDKAAWAPRLKLGIDGLTATAIKGIGAMPPRGGSSASDADSTAGVLDRVPDGQ